ncbi:MAG: hypothetical protein CBE08_002095 [Euryarchaeota archaeon TMED248]|nr:MAG: hypothetical protein CBE08_002095 [Euryarchaeota archaeon TMED248]
MSQSQRSDTKVNHSKVDNYDPKTRVMKSWKKRISLYEGPKIEKEKKPSPPKKEISSANDINWKNILFSGAATGAIIAIMVLIVVIIFIFEPVTQEGLFFVWFSLAVFSAYIVAGISEYAQWPEVSLKILIPVGCFTSVIPLSGPIFGMPNYEPMTLVTVVAIGALGGFFWSIPFALWSFFSVKFKSEEE